MMRGFRRALLALCGLLAAPLAASAEPPVYYFGVVNQRSLTLTAQYWNPILNYVSARAGIALQLKMGQTAPETTAQTLAGEHAFAYTNHLFTPARDKLGFRVILRLQAPPIYAVVIVPNNSPIASLEALRDKTVVFPSKEAFVGYWVPMDHLLKQGIRVEALFAGNQEGAIARLRAGGAAAAAVNESTLKSYARRENFEYRVLWRSAPYLDIPIMVRPDIPADLVEKVQAAFTSMADDPEGARILAQSAAAVQQTEPIRFLPATDAEYANYRQFYRDTQVTDR